MADAEVLQTIRSKADLVISTFSKQLDKELSLDESSVEWIDGYIERVRKDFPREKRIGLVTVLGSFVGECIIKTFGGIWKEDDGRWGVSVTEHFWACPFTKIEKQFENGVEDSVGSFFRTIPVLAKLMVKE